MEFRIRVRNIGHRVVQFERQGIMPAMTLKDAETIVHEYSSVLAIECLNAVALLCDPASTGAFGNHPGDETVARQRNPEPLPYPRVLSATRLVTAGKQCCRGFIDDGVAAVLLNTGQR